MDRLCQGDAEVGKEYFTPESVRLLEGLGTFDAEPYRCNQAGFTVGDGTMRHAGFATVALTAGDSTLDLVLVQRDGNWLIDLFFTEESAYFGEELPML